MARIGWCFNHLKGLDELRGLLGHGAGAHRPRREAAPGGWADAAEAWIARGRTRGVAVELRQAAVAGAEVRDFLRQRGSAVVARRGELVDAMARPAVVATDSSAVAGVLTYDVVGDSCEILTLHAARQWAGIGSAMVVMVIPIRDEIELVQNLPLGFARQMATAGVTGSDRCSPPDRSRK